MKLTGKKIAAFLNRPKLGVKAVLLYGPDQGLVREYVQRLSTKFTPNVSDPFAVSEFTGPQLKSDTSILFDAAFSMSLGRGDCVIIIREAQDAIVSTLEHVYSQPVEPWPIIIEANTLTPKSTLRKMFEQSKYLVSIACYPEEGYALISFITNFLAQEGLSINNNASQFLCASLAGDRQIVRRELEKLTLFCQSKQSRSTIVTEEDIIACIGDSSESSLDNLVYSVGDGDQAGIDKSLAKAFMEGVNPIAVIRSIQQHFQRLHYVHSQMATGKPLDQAIGALRPPVFFKN